MGLCVAGQHRWDAQVALAKGGIEDGDPCACGAVRFGKHATLEKGIRDALADGGLFVADLVEGVRHVVTDRARYSCEAEQAESAKLDAEAKAQAAMGAKAQAERAQITLTRKLDEETYLRRALQDAIHSAGCLLGVDDQGEPHIRNHAAEAAEQRSRALGAAIRREHGRRHGLGTMEECANPTCAAAVDTRPEGA